MCSLAIYNTVYANYIIILSRRDTGIDGVSLCWVLKGVLGKRLSLGGAGIAKAVARHCWLVAAGSVGKELYQRHGGVGCLSRVRNNQQSAHFHALFFPWLLWRWGLVSLRDCPLCNLKVFKKATG